MLNIDSILLNYNKINLKEIRTESQIQLEAKVVTDNDGGWKRKI